MSKKIYLHQLLSRSGRFTGKSEAIAALRAGEITVGGRMVRTPLFQLDPAKMEVRWKGKPLAMIEENAYFIINKPLGFLSSRLTQDDIRLKKRSVFELLRGIAPRLERTLFCVGRLDEDTGGLLVITNDGKLSHILTDPDHDVEKTYFCRLVKPLTAADKNRIEKGIEIDMEENGRKYKYLTKPCRLSFERNGIIIRLREGKKREVRRIFEAVNNTVFSLRRIAIGGLTLKIPEGTWMKSTKKAITEAVYGHEF